jgi:hypothetical protein
MQPSNDNTDPFASPGTALAELYRLRREVLKEDVSSMPFERRRRREECLRNFAQAEAGLLAVLPPS